MRAGHARMPTRTEGDQKGIKRAEAIRSDTPHDIHAATPEYLEITYVAQDRPARD